MFLGNWFIRFQIQQNLSEIKTAAKLRKVEFTSKRRPSYLLMGVELLCVDAEHTLLSLCFRRQGDRGPYRLDTFL